MSTELIISIIALSVSAVTAITVFVLVAWPNFIIKRSCKILEKEIKEKIDNETI